jgi:hypothetical protein
MAFACGRNLHSAFQFLAKYRASLRLMRMTARAILVVVLLFTSFSASLAQSGVLEFRNVEANPAKPEEPKTFTVKWDTITSVPSVSKLPPPRYDDFCIFRARSDSFSVSLSLSLCFCSRKKKKLVLSCRTPLRRMIESWCISPASPEGTTASERCRRRSGQKVRVFFAD